MKTRTSRRHVLRAAGVALALPWMESLNSGIAHAATARPPKRFIPIYMPNGASVLWWKTTGSGAGNNWKLSPLLSPFEAFKSKMLLVRQMGNFTWRKDLLTMNPGWTTFASETTSVGCAECLRAPSWSPPFALPLGSAQLH